jgi:hypothetical protein
MNMKVYASYKTLGDRLGIIRHISPLRMKVRRLMGVYPSPGDDPAPEDWLMDVAIRRGLNQFVRDSANGRSFHAPPLDAFPMHELVVALCYTGGLDRPQLIRMAGLLVSRYEFDMPALIRLVELERAEMIMAELAQAALRCDPVHRRWQILWERFSGFAGTSSPVIHWSRLAEPITGKFHRIEGWRLAS